MNKAQRIIGKLPPWILTAVTTVAILWLTLAPRPLGDLKPELFPGADKVVHAIMFGGLALMVFVDRSRAHGWSRIPLSFMIISTVAVMAFGAGIEFLQEMMHAGRSFDVCDIWADIAGAALSAILWTLLTRFYYGAR